MQMKKKISNKGSSVQTGNVQHVIGNINIAGRDSNIRETVTIHQDANAEIVKALTEALDKTRKRPKTTRAKKSGIEKEVKEIEVEIGKKKPKPGFLAERFRNIAQMAPDILEVIIAGLGNPTAAIGMTVKKIAQKAKAEAEKESAKK